MATCGNLIVVVFNFKNMVKISQLQLACSATSRCLMSVTADAAQYGIARTTLRRRLQNPSPNFWGGQTKFTPAEEHDMENLLTSCADLDVSLIGTAYHKTYKNRESALDYPETD